MTVIELKQRITELDEAQDRFVQDVKRSILLGECEDPVGFMRVIKEWHDRHVRDLQDPLHTGR